MASPGKEVNVEVFSFLHAELVEHTLGARGRTRLPSGAQARGDRLRGGCLVERYTRDRPRFSDRSRSWDHLQGLPGARRALLRLTAGRLTTTATALRYEVYRKQIDKLQTNNRGVYMLDKLLLARCSPAARGRREAARCAVRAVPERPHRGALHLGVSAVVGVE